MRNPRSARPLRNRASSLRCTRSRAAHPAAPTARSRWRVARPSDHAATPVTPRSPPPPTPAPSPHTPSAFPIPSRVCPSLPHTPCRAPARHSPARRTGSRCHARPHHETPRSQRTQKSGAVCASLAGARTTTRSAWGTTSDAATNATGMTLGRRKNGGTDASHRCLRTVAQAGFRPAIMSIPVTAAAPEYAHAGPSSAISPRTPPQTRDRFGRACLLLAPAPASWPLCRTLAAGSPCLSAVRLSPPTWVAS